MEKPNILKINTIIKKRKLLNYSARLIGIFAFIYILSTLDLNTTKHVVGKTNFFFLFVAFLFNLIILIVKSMRWKAILDKIGENISFLKATLYFSSGVFLGIVTPAKIGEIAKIVYLKHENISYTKGFVSIVIDRLQDIVFFLIIGFSGIVVFFPHFFSFHQNKIILFSIGTCVLAGAALMLRKKITALLFFRFPTIQQTFSNIKGYMNYNLFYTLVYTFLAICFSYMQVWLISLAFGFQLDLPKLIAVVSIAELISLLPISISGIGTRDAVFIFFLQTETVNTESIVLFSTAILIIAYIGTAFFGYIAYLIKPVEIPDLKSFSIKKYGEKSN